MLVALAAWPASGFPHDPYDAGSRIVSLGFGTQNDNGGNYTQEAEDIDAFAWDHKDYLVVIGAGNEGAPEQYSSIRQEAQAKNVILLIADGNGVGTVSRPCQAGTNGV